MKLSIIIPMYKVEKYIERCLISTQKQDVDSSEYEVICINDGSPDNSKVIAEAFASQYENIKVYSQNNEGLSSARNTGIDLANGDYIFFLDSDDWIAENILGKIIFKLNTEKPDVLCICSCRSNGLEYGKVRFFNDELPLDGPTALSYGLRPEAPFSIVKTTFLRDNNFKFYKGIFHEDSELTPRIHYQANKVSFLNDLVYYYFLNDQSIMTTPNPKKALDLINVVCPNLSVFATTNVKSSHKFIFDNLISMYLNNAMAFIQKCDKDSQIRFKKELGTKQKLYTHLIHSTILKYRFEGYLFMIMPKYSLFIYNLLQRFKH